MTTTVQMIANPEMLDKVLDVGRALVPHQRPDGGLEIMVPPNYRTMTLPALEPTLTRIRQRVCFKDAASFIAYVKKYQASNTVIFGMPGHMAADKKAAFQAILDYHHDAADGRSLAPDHAAHVAVYAPPYSPAWETWNNTRPMAQADFGEFLEENRVDIRDPVAAQLIDLVNNLKLSKKVDYDSVVNRPNGDILLAFSDKTEAEGSRNGGPMKVPSEITLGLSVYYAGDLYALKMLMRYRLNNGKVAFMVKPDRPEDVEQDAFNKLTQKINEETGISVWLGSAA